MHAAETTTSKREWILLPLSIDQQQEQPLGLWASPINFSRLIRGIEIENEEDFLFYSSVHKLPEGVIRSTWNQKEEGENVPVVSLFLPASFFRFSPFLLLCACVSEFYLRVSEKKSTAKNLDDSDWVSKSLDRRMTARKMCRQYFLYALRVKILLSQELTSNENVFLSCII